MKAPFLPAIAAAAFLISGPSVAVAADAVPAAAPAATGEALRAFGLDKLHWGMSGADLAKVMPGLKPLETGDTGSADLENPAYIFSGCKFDLEIELTKDKLSDVALLSDINDANCMLDLGGALTAKYGMPYVTEPDDVGTVSKWQGATTISFSHSPIDQTHGRIEFYDSRG